MKGNNPFQLIFVLAVYHLFFLGCFSAQADGIPPSVVKFIDAKFSGAENRSMIWECTEKFQSFRGYNFFYARSSLRVPLRKKKEVIVAVDVNTQDIHLLGSKKNEQRDLKFLVELIKIEDLQRENVLMDFCELITEVRQGTGHQVLNADNIASKHIFSIGDISIKNKISRPSLEREKPNNMRKIIFYTSKDSDAEVWKHIIVFSIGKKTSLISSVNSIKVGEFVELQNIKK